MNNYNNEQEIVEDIALEIRSQSLTVPIDPSFTNGTFWSLQSGTTGSANFEAVWEFATGQGVTVGLVDEGVNYHHLDLTAGYAQELDFDPRDPDGEQDGLPDDLESQHGTEVAGIISGAIDNDIGTIGAAPGARITALQIRYGTSVDMDELELVMQQQQFVDVANNSWGFTRAFADNFLNWTFSGLGEGIRDAAELGRDGLGTAMVMAAGNARFVVDGVNLGDDSNFHNLTNSRFVIAVGAYDYIGQAAPFSSAGTNVLISAPGVGLMTTSGNEIGATGSSWVSGTSFAAPLTSSAIALMLEVNPNLGYRDIQEILAITARPSDAEDVVHNGAGNINGAGLVFDREMGFGRLDALAAVNLARTWTAQSTAANEQHLEASFDAVEYADPLRQTLSVTVENPGTGEFALDFVELTLTLTDQNLRDLEIRLTSPDGTTAVLAENFNAAGNRTTLNFTLSSVVTWGENPFGEWTVEFIHTAPSDGISIGRAELDLYGDYVGADDTYFYTSAYGALVAEDAGRSIRSDDDGGTDTLNFSAADRNLTLDLSSAGSSFLGSAEIQLDGQFENVVGTIHDDVIAGSSVDNTLDGDYGTDRLHGGAGADTLRGGNGDDFLDGGDDADRLEGGLGFDTVVYGGTGPLTLNLADTDGSSGEARGDTYVGVELFRMGTGDDSLIGSDAGDAVRGAGGNDTMRGGLGADALYGDDGADLIEGGADNDNIEGGGGNDRILGGTGNDRILGDVGDDVIQAGAGADIVDGGSGFDIVSFGELGPLTLNLFNAAASTGEALGDVYTAIERFVLTPYADLVHGSVGKDQVFGGAGNDGLSGNDGADELFGDAGNDQLRGDDGNDKLLGGIGDDILVGGRGADAMDGGSGFDVVAYTGNGPVMLNLFNAALSSGDAYLDTFRDVEQFLLTNHADTLIGSAGADTVKGAAGDDALYGGDGADTLFGDAGHDLLQGDAGNDLLLGGTGNDILMGSVGTDAMDGGEGFDTVVYDGNGPITLNLETAALSTGHAHRDVYRGIEQFRLTNYADRLVGSTGDDTVRGAGGNDTMQGGAGVDALFGDAGNDVVQGEAGADYLAGGAGNDKLLGGAGHDLLIGGLGADAMDGGSGTDTVSYEGDGAVTLNLLNTTLSSGHARGDTYRSVEQFVLTDLGDLMFGSAGSDTVRGAGGGDMMLGGSGNDQLFGEAGNDVIRGGAGSDLIVGGLGQDVMFGEAGSDRFTFHTIVEIGRRANADQIHDFSSSEDVIDLSAIDANSLVASNQGFVFNSLAGAAFTGNAGELIFDQIDVAGTANDRTMIYGDIDGDRIADFELHLYGLVSLDGGDFLL